MDSAPRLACPHCGAATIAAADKLECGMFGPPCKCSACGGYSRELKWPRAGLSLLLYVAPYALVLLFWGVWWLAGRPAGPRLGNAMMPVLGGAALWQYWLAGKVEAHFARRIALGPVFPTQPWRHWAVFKQLCAAIFLAAILGTFLFAWWAGRQ